MSADLPVLREKIERRKKPETEPEILREISGSLLIPQTASEYRCKALLGTAPEEFAAPVKTFEKRDIYSELQAYLYSEEPRFREKVLILYGLRRTGKTTMMRQAISDMDGGSMAEAAYIQIRESNTVADLDHDLEKLSGLGVRYFFIDEATKMKDFISGSAVLADIFAASGKKIVLSGTDSLGFMFAEDGELYDRCAMLHTTHISFSEFARVLGYDSLDTYIQFGGTMTGGGTEYNTPPQIFADAKNTRKYANTAIADNIQNSLKLYKYGGHFRSLWDLYDADELTGAINRVIEDVNHRFTPDVLTRDFESSDLQQTKENYRKDKYNRLGIFESVDEKAVIGRMMQTLKIKNLDEQTVAVTKSQVAEIREYLLMPDAIGEIDVYNASAHGGFSKRTVISQPGLRYAQAEALVDSLFQDDAFGSLFGDQKKEVRLRIMNGVKGRLPEDIVLLEMRLVHPEKRVMHADFAKGDIDMTVADPQTHECSLFEIKYSERRGFNRSRHITDREKCRIIENNFGAITGRYVLYRGETAETEDEVQYVDVQDYLLNGCSLPREPEPEVNRK